MQDPVAPSIMRPAGKSHPAVAPMASSHLSTDHLVIASQARRIRELESRIEWLEKLATTDDLSGLMNRRGFAQAFMVERGRLRRGISIGAVVVTLEVHQFRTICDSIGRAAGDACLKLVAQTIARDIRDMDTAARLSEDEFALLFGNTEADLALERIQRLSYALNKLSVSCCNSGQEFNVPISVSVGIQMLTPHGKLDDLSSRIITERLETETN